MLITTTIIAVTVLIVLNIPIDLLDPRSTEELEPCALECSPCGRGLVVASEGHYLTGLMRLRL